MILDTCGLIFLAAGSERLSQETRALLGRQTHRWYCAITAFEIGQKYQAGKLGLPRPPSAWLADAVKRYQLSEIPVDSGLCLAAAELPPYHRDPCDRMIIAAALRLQVPVVTSDPQFAAYGIQTIC